MSAEAPIIDFDVGILKCRVEINNGQFRVDLHASIAGSSWNNTVIFSYHQPEAKLSTPSILGAYLAIDLTFVDKTGELHVRTQLHTAFGDVPPVGAALRVLPPFVFGMIASGALFPQVLSYASLIATSGLDYHKTVGFANVFRDKAAVAEVSVAALQSTMQETPSFSEKLLGLLPTDRGVLERMANVSPTVWHDAFMALAKDPRIERLYPGTRKRFGLPALSAKSVASVESPGDPAKIAAELLKDVALFFGAVGAVITAVAGFLLTLMALLLVPPFTLIGIIGIAVLICVFAVGVIFLGIAAIAAFVALIINTVLAFKGSKAEAFAEYNEYIQSYGGVKLLAQ